jgi:hypothetical protein
MAIPRIAACSERRCSGDANGEELFGKVKLALGSWRLESIAEWKRTKATKISRSSRPNHLRRYILVHSLMQTLTVAAKRKIEVANQYPSFLMTGFV